jgi:HEPN domain-containing protein
MILRDQLRRLAQGSLTDAEILLHNQRWKGAYYLCGYAVEIALKERICHTLNWDGYPASGGEFTGYASFKTHDLDILLRLSGWEKPIRTHYRAAWYAIRDWKPEVRYAAAEDSVEDHATQMLINARIVLEALWNAAP